MKKRFKKLLIILLIFAFAGVAVLYGLSAHIHSATEEVIFENGEDVPDVFTAIVLGASVRSNGNLSMMLEDRVKSAYQLYKDGKVKRFLLSGDNGSKNYNEPQAMKEYLINLGVPEEDIFLDYAGFDTYDSMYRASSIFNVKDAVVVTQKFHLPRAIYISQKLGLNYYGLIGDKHIYQREGANQRRELLANVKAYSELLMDKEPTYLGSQIPIDGPPQSTYDLD